MRVKSQMRISEWLDGLIKDEVRSDPLEYARHKTFITSHFFGGLCALLLLPYYLFHVQAPDLLGLLVIAWLFLPCLISLYVAKSAKLKLGYLLSSLSLGGLVSFLAVMTGGISSFLLPWLVVVPVEAALSGSRRVVVSALVATCVCLISLALTTRYGFLPDSLPLPQNTAFLVAIGLVSAVSYVGGLALSIQKMHQRSHKELALREERYRLLAENASDMITRHDENGKVRFASGGVRDLLGLSSEDILGDGLFERVHVADRPAFLRAFVQALELQLNASVEFRLKDQAGRFKWVEMYCRPEKEMSPETRSEPGKSEGKHRQNLVAITRDITNQKGLNASLEDAKQSAEQANKAKSLFLANMSHELRTPLNAIIGFSEVLKGASDMAATQDQRDEYASIIHQSGTHLLSVVNDLLDMSKLEDGAVELKKEHVSLSEVALEVVALLMPEATKAGVIIKAPVARKDITLFADRRAVKQILINLLSNAVKFSEKGSKVRIMAIEEEQTQTIMVKDEGEGIPKDIIPQLGKPFVQAETDYNRSHEGSGLGLSIVKGLAELHGGEMKIESDKGVGTQISISLPKANSEADEIVEKVEEKRRA